MRQAVISLAMATILTLSVPSARLLAAGEFQCLDGDGQPLDWFAMLKQPDSGQYAYVSSKSPGSWIQPQQANVNSNGPLFSTVSQVLPGSRAAGLADVLAAYNDEPPGAAASLRKGHMKGLAALTAGQRGFWLIHSVPKFPDLSQERYEYPPTGIMYGQSFLCLTVNSSAMAESIGRQLFASHPYVYSISVSASAAAAWPSWTELKENKSPPTSLMNSTVQLVTSGGLSVLHLAKSPHLKHDLYSYLLADQLASSIQVETWQHGNHLLNSTCDRRYNVTKILQLQIGSMPDFYSTEDHSKWCVTVGNGSRPHVCIGDMNRAETQFSRGGGIACIGLPALHGLFKDIVLRDQACKSASVSRELLLALYNWVMVAVVCAMASTLLSVAVLVWLALARNRRSGSCPEHLTGGRSGPRYRIL